MIRRLPLLLLAVVIACSRSETPPAATSARTPPATTATTTAAPPAVPSFDAAIVWLKTAPRFAFVLEEGGARAEGEMTRERVGAEQVRFRTSGVEWTGSVTPQGLTWKSSGSTGDGPPPFANHLYQRVTLGFDPQKKEGAAQLVSSDAGGAHYRFTDANTGDVWNVRVRPDGSIGEISIGETVRLQITR